MRIKKVIRCLNKSDHAIIEVELEDGSSGEVFVGGNCQVYYHHGKIKVFVMKGKPSDSEKTSISSR